MLALLVKDDGEGGWVGLPSRTLVPAFDPCAGLVAAKRALGLQPHRAIAVKALDEHLAAITVTDIRNFASPTPGLKQFGVSQQFYGPVLLVATRTQYQEPSQDPTVLDHEPTLIENLTAQHIRARIGDDAADSVRLLGGHDEQPRPPASQLLAIRSLAKAEPGSDAAAQAFDEVTTVVNEFVALNNAKLREVSSHFTAEPVRYFYTAIADMQASEQLQR